MSGDIIKGIIMLIAFLIYLINVFESIQKLACIFLIIGVCLIGVAFLFSVVTNSLDNEIDEKVAKKVIKFSSIFFIVLSLIVVFVPKSETMYLMRRARCQLLQQNYRSNKPR